MAIGELERNRLLNGPLTEAENALWEKYQRERPWLSHLLFHRLTLSTPRVTVNRWFARRDREWLRYYEAHLHA